jgi:chromosome segregation ATPase
MGVMSAELERGTPRRVAPSPSASHESSSKRKRASRDAASDSDEEDGQAGSTAERLEAEEKFNRDEVELSASAVGGDTQSGKIKKIEMEDFMCHKRMTVELHPQINFITGQNGSGKSAVIVALQTCLGMTANQTGRGKTLSSLIREGATGDAVVRVTLYNNGSDAFEPETYGSSLVIERTIKKGAGASAYRVLNGDTDKVVTTKKRDVDLIVEKYNISVNNPCCVLDQETSKSFLRGDAKNKYAIFMRATHLEAMERHYHAEKKRREEARGALQTQKDSLGEVAREVQAKEQAVAELTRLKSLNTRLAETQRQLARRIARDHRAEAAAFAAARDKVAAKLQSREEELALAQGGVRDGSSLVADAERAVDAAVAEKNAVGEDKKRCQAEQEEVKGEVRKAAAGEKKAAKAVQEAEQSVRAHVAELGRLAKQDEGKDERKAAAARARAEQVAAARARVERQDAKLKQLEAAVLQASKEREEHEALARAAGGDDLRAAADEMADANRALSTAEQKLSDPRARFGSDVPKLMAELESCARDFTRPPLHIGLGTELVDMSWWRVVESQLFNELQTVVLFDRTDMAKLKQLCTRIRVPVPKMVFVKWQATRHDTRRAVDLSAHELAVTMDSVLRFADQNIFNALVDAKKIESMVMVRSKADAERVLFSRDAQGRLCPPRGVQRVITAEGDEYMLRNGSEYKVAADRRSAAAPTIVSGVQPTAAEIDELRAAQARTRVQHDALLRKKTALEQDANAAFRRGKQAAQSLKDAAVELDRMQADLMSAEHKASKADAADDDDDSNFQRERLQAVVQQAETAVQTAQAALEATKEQHAAAIARLAPFTEREAGIDRRAAACDQAVDRARKKSEAAELSTKKQQSELAGLHNKLRKAREDLDAHNSRAESAARAAEESEKSSLHFCADDEGNAIETAETEDSAEQLTKKVAVITKHIEAERAKLGGRSDEAVEAVILKAQRELERVQVKYETIKAQVKSWAKTLKSFSKANKRRLDGWTHMRVICQDKMHHLFSQYLQHREHKGDVVFDDSKGTLDFTWNKHAGAEASQDDNDADGGGEEEEKEEEEEEEEGGDDEDDERGRRAPKAKKRKTDKGAPSSAAGTDAGQLSGGEKSFTTLSFLLAMGALVDCPFRVLDEFDVFMDQANRKTSLTLLLTIARQKINQGKQYIMITPHSLDGIDRSKGDVRVLKMQPLTDEYRTRTEQTTLGFQRAGN